MAEPQTTTGTEQARGKGDAAPITQARSFDELKAQPVYGETLPPGVEAGAGAPAPAAELPAAPALTESRRSALDPFLAIQYDFGRWFDDVWRQTFGFRHSAALPFGALRGFGPAGLFGLPPADLRETTAAHLLAIELPGLSRNDIDVSLDGDTLVISGHKAEEADGAAAAYRVSERRFGRFERTFPLPPDVDRTKIEARFQDGVLKIILPKDPSAATGRSRIEIKG